MKILGKIIVIISTSLCCAQIFAVVVNGGQSGSGYMQSAPAVNNPAATNQGNNPNYGQPSQNPGAPVSTNTPGIQPDPSSNPGVQPDPSSNPGLQPAS